jgi:hypothetical protein
VVHTCLLVARIPQQRQSDNIHAGTPHCTIFVHLGTG